MADKIINSRIVSKNDTESNWTANDPILLDGECVFVRFSDGSVRAKVGDGASRFDALPYADDDIRADINNIISLPSSSSADNGKILSVQNGVASWVEMTYKVVPITQTEYDALASKDSNTLYVIGV